MSGTIRYSRPKSTTTNNTDMTFTIQVAEHGNAYGTIPAGATGVLDAKFLVDADESGGTSIKDHGVFSLTPSIDPASGRTTYTVTFTPVLGDGTLGAAQTATFDHPSTMDAWQTAAGRARQS